MTFFRAAVGSAFICSALAGVLMSGPSERGGETKLRLEVPKTVAEQASQRTGGDAHASPPILMLEGLELGYNEGLTITVLGPPQSGSSQPGPILAVSGMVGQPQKTLKTPLQKTTLAIPLNDKASQLLVGRREVTLILKSEGRPPLKVDRAYFLNEETTK